MIKRSHDGSKGQFFYVIFLRFADGFSNVCFIPPPIFKWVWFSFYGFYFPEHKSSDWSEDFGPIRFGDSWSVDYGPRALTWNGIKQSFRCPGIIKRRCIFCRQMCPFCSSRSTKVLNTVLHDLFLIGIYGIAIIMYLDLHNRWQHRFIAMIFQCWF